MNDTNRILSELGKVTDYQIKRQKFLTFLTDRSRKKYQWKLKQRK